MKLRIKKYQSSSPVQCLYLPHDLKTSPSDGCIQSLEWTSGLEWWTGLMDWTSGLRYFPFLPNIWATGHKYASLM